MTVLEFPSRGAALAEFDRRLRAWDRRFTQMLNEHGLVAAVEACEAEADELLQDYYRLNPKREP